jgi:hypothetical protein
MKIKLIEVTTRNAAKNAAPWAAKIAKVCGGYMAFESVTDYAIWKNQK